MSSKTFDSGPAAAASAASTSAGGSSSSAAALLNQPIVMDLGTATIKAGFAGGAKPKVVIGTKVGRPKHTRVMPGGALDQDSIGSTTSASTSYAASSSQAPTFVGETLDRHRGAFILSHPMDRGHLQDASPSSLDALEKLILSIYSKSNLYCKTDQHPILLTEAPLNPRSHREMLAELFFETMRAPAIFFSPPAVLSLYASGRATGVVLDVGEGVTHCVPVYEGYALTHSIVRSDVAGRDVTRRLQLLLRKSGLAFTTTAESELVQKMKEELCFVRPSNFVDDGWKKLDVGTASSSGVGGGGATTAAGTTATTSSTTSGGGTTTGSDKTRVVYQLPDGQTVTVSDERYMAPEILFQPSLIGSEEVGVASALVDSIMKSDLDLRPTLFSQIVLAGGSTCTPGFGDRLLSEVRALSPVHTRIRISAPPERVHSAWMGGSILASLATFKDMWVTREEYEEHGVNVLHRMGF